jgi:hypothetical protein
MHVTKIDRVVEIYAHTTLQTTNNEYNANTITTTTNTITITMIR